MEKDKATKILNLLKQYDWNETPLFEVHKKTFDDVELVKSEWKKLTTLKSSLINGNYLITPEESTYDGDGNKIVTQKAVYFDPETDNIFDYLTSEIIDVKENYDSL